MNFQKIILTICLALMAMSINAQTLIDDLRRMEAGKGKVTVQQSKEIDDLVNGNRNIVNQNTPKTPTASSNNVSQTTTASIPNNETTKPEQRSTTAKIDAATPTDNYDTDVVVDTRKKVMRNSYKTTGYRIQVFSGGNSRNDRQKAEEAGATVKRMFPNEPVYVHFYSPSWKCRMGNYRSTSEAQKYLKQIKTVYPQACIVKGTISVQY